MRYFIKSPKINIYDILRPTTILCDIITGQLSNSYFSSEFGEVDAKRLNIVKRWEALDDFFNSNYATSLGVNTTSFP